MARPQFSIGIDLGTTNCAMAFEAFETSTPQSELFLVPQWETLTGFSEASTLPSFLYLPPEAEIQAMTRESDGRAEWIAGRLARKRAAESPGRVVHSAKSWLCHHAVDRNAPFLPWRSDEIPVEKRISPIRASALLLQHLRAAWNTRFAAEGFQFEEQDITITVPASFDAVAQRLTLDAAREAGFPEDVRLLEEPQAAFYRWLEHGDAQTDLWKRPVGGAYHVLVIDVGGGTTDFTLFEIASQSGTPIPHIKRIAVSDHLLLGGDNIDLAIAHRVESRLADRPLSSTQWNFLVALCRDVKERCLSDTSGYAFPLSIPGRGSNLLSGTLTDRIERAEIESIVLDGFFPQCDADDRPARTQAGLREWALPYAADSAVTRYLAEFLRDRPAVDAILLNGGSLYPERLRHRLQEQIARWQDGAEPQILHNPEPSLAVARGAARFGSIVRRRAQRIEAGAARAIYLEVHQGGTKDDKTSDPALICILPKGAASEANFRVSEGGLELRINRLVRFQPYYSTRRSQDKAGSLVRWNNRDFHALPPLQTTARLSGRRPQGDKLPVILTARINELGLLQLACVSADPGLRETWPLEFNLRPHESGTERQGDTDDDTSAGSVPGIDPDRLEAARARITTLFSRPLDRRDKLTATNLLKSLERILSLAKADWNYVLIRSLWSALHQLSPYRKESIEHEETWLILAGFLLRPGFGVERDAGRIDELWQLHVEGAAYSAKRIQLQLYILWRRVAGGLSRERQEAILAPELPRLRAQKNSPAELVRLVGSFERINPVAKAELIDQFLRTTRELAGNKQYCAPYLAALGLLLNRTPLYAGLENVIPPVQVEKAYDVLSDLDWTEPELGEIQTLFLRAGRVVDHPDVDLPGRLREKIATKLQKSGVAPARIARLRTFVPIAQVDRASLFGESLPPGLVIGEG
jgi:molecular chaperone DnaK (HSP70)